MKKIFGWLNFFPFRWAILVGFVALALVMTGMLCGLSKSDWSGWVQAFAATVGIAIAIWLPYKQRVDAINAEAFRRQDDARRIRLALKDELMALQNKFPSRNLSHLLSLGPDDIFDRLIPIKTVRFPIYASVIDRLTLIDDDALRSEIIAAYEWADAMPTTVELNNGLLLELRDIEAELHYRGDEFQRQRREFQLRRLQETREALQTICRTAVDLVNGVVPKL